MYRQGVHGRRCTHGGYLAVQVHPTGTQYGPCTGFPTPLPAWPDTANLLPNTALKPGRHGQTHGQTIKGGPKTARGKRGAGEASPARCLNSAKCPAPAIKHETTKTRQKWRGHGEGCGEGTPSPPKGGACTAASVERPSFSSAASVERDQLAGPASVQKCTRARGTAGPCAFSHYTGQRYHWPV